MALTNEQLAVRVESRADQAVADMKERVRARR